jgi:predicted 2-oxoglutarate/Fe(II)-dependent dioxygenase YbiX
VARLYGALPPPEVSPQVYRPQWLLIDPALSLRAILPIDQSGEGTARLIAALRQLPPPERHLGIPAPAPILILPGIFEPACCDRLIGLYRAQEREMSGFMRDENGQTVGRHDPSFKVRRDYMLEDQELIRAVQERILRKVVPQIERVHFFRATRMERYMVGGYSAEDGGHFRPHRDNTTAGTAHRRFAVSINLNGDFDGGEVSFPEYGPQGYKAPPGAAVIFSCSLLHAVARVTRGTRYAFLPFLYDDAAARIREANAARVPEAAGYVA